MKVTDQNDQPIADVSSLPNVEPEGGSALAILVPGPSGFPGPGVLPPVLGTTAADDQVGSTEDYTPCLRVSGPTGPTGTTEDEDNEISEPKLSPRDYLIKRLRHMQVRLTAYGQYTKGQKCSLTLVSAAASIGLALEHAAELPDDWKPVRTAAPSTEMSVGSHVVIRDRFRKVYQDDLSEADMDGLVVDRIGEKRMRCKTPGGALVLIPAGHVDLA